MANTKLTIQHKNNVFEPPVEDGVKIEWERTGSPGKLTFTVVQPPNEKLNFLEGDQVRFYYDDKCVFCGYVFKKKRDKEQKIEVTCYDQIRYLKNKYTYVFENKTATQIVQALCKDFSLSIGTFDNTKYVIPAIAEENISALDIILDVLGETIMNTGNMFVLYDDAGKLQLKNAANMKTQTLIFEESAENFDYTSSIDDETYNRVVLYYKSDDNQIQIYTASSPSRIKEWGLLQYFEETDTRTSGQNKANALLKLFNKKTRELKVTGAFGDISVRGGTLIPVKLDLGDVTANNYMLVDKVTHLFENNLHTMDLTLEGEWDDDKTTDTVSKTIGEIVDATAVETNLPKYTVTITDNGRENRGIISGYYTNAKGPIFKVNFAEVAPKVFSIEQGQTFALRIDPSRDCKPFSVVTTGSMTGKDSELLTCKEITFTINKDSSVHINWSNGLNIDEITDIMNTKPYTFGIDFEEEEETENDKSTSIDQLFEPNFPKPYQYPDSYDSVSRGGGSF